MESPKRMNWGYFLLAMLSRRAREIGVCRQWDESDVQKMLYQALCLKPLILKKTSFRDLTRNSKV